MRAEHAQSIPLRVKWPGSWSTLDNSHDNPNGDDGEDYRKLDPKWILAKKSQCQWKPLTSKRVRDVNCLVQQQSDTPPPSFSDLFNAEPINSALKKSYAQTHTSL